MADTKFKNSACFNYESLLEDYIDGALGEAEAEVAAHLRDCTGCSSALDEAARSVRLLRVAEYSAAPAPGFANNVMARIRSSEQERTAERAGFWQPFIAWGWRFAATATLALAVLLTYNAGWIRQAQPSVTSVRPMDGVDIFAPEPARPPANGYEVLVMVADTTHGK
jgi:anti-sigma-K factor RskA